MAGPLAGFKILEIAGIGPGPFAAMLLSDMGAEVIRVDRADRVRGGDAANPPRDIMNRGRRNIGLDMKSPEGIETLLQMVGQSDALIEGFRPGVMERLGVGPDVCLARNPRLVYGRMTGFGQEGPLSQAAGHDINYISVAGVLHAIGRKGEPPLPPLNLVGDFGGGGMFLAFGVVCALLERANSGKGQVVDAAMVDGASILMTMMFGMRALGFWEDQAGTNLLDSGSHFYDTYETKDGKYVSVGSIEPQFYALLMKHTDQKTEDWPQMSREQWPEMKQKMAAIFRSKTRDEWCEIMEGTDVCFAPVLSMDEAPLHPHNQHRKTFVEHNGQVQPAPAPRFSRTSAELDLPCAHIGQHTDEVLASFGFSSGDIAKLRDAKAVA